MTEAIVLAEFMKAGIPVSVPFGEKQRYDLIADVHGTLLRVQCKTGRVVQNASVLVFNATSHDGHRARQGYRNQADLFAVYSPHTQQVYVLDVNEVGETSVWLRLTPALNNQEIGVRHAEEHTLESWAAGWDRPKGTHPAAWGSAWREFQTPSTRAGLGVAGQ